jgi:hypothetical protein
MKTERVPFEGILAHSCDDKTRTKLFELTRVGIRTFILVFREDLLSDHSYEAGL